MKRFIQRLEEFEKSLNTLKEVLDLNEDKNDIVRDSIIKRFEYTFECAWKTLDQFMIDGGGQEYVKNVKTIFKEANNRRITKNTTPYLEMIDFKSNISQEYKDIGSVNISSKIRSEYFVLLVELYSILLVNYEIEKSG